MRSSGRSYFSLTAQVREAECERLQLLLHQGGAAGLEVRDSKTLPMPRVRTPTAGRSLVIAFFSKRPVAERAFAQVSRDLPRVRCSLRRVPWVDWSRGWKSRVRSNRIGRVWVGPPWDDPPKQFGGVCIRIEPKMAFGTGDHPTTALCLQAIDEFLSSHSQSSVLDLGTGSGVLAIAAEKLGARRVVALDNDPLCVAAARENCGANLVSRVEISNRTLDRVNGKFDLVVANVVANTLVGLAPLVASKVRERLVLSGVLVPQGREVELAYRRQRLAPCGTRKRGQWLRLDFQPG